MNLLLLHEADRLDPPHGLRFRVTDHRHTHLTTVLNARPHQMVRVGLWNGPRGCGRIVQLTPDATDIDVEWTEDPPHRSHVHLILAIPRPKSLKKLLPQIVALGVGRLTLLRSWRVAQPYLSSPLLQPAPQRPLIADGLMQAGCTRPPIVDVALRFQPFIDDVVPTLDADIKLVGHPRAQQRLSDVRPDRRAIVVAIGPEGGWVDYELEAFERAGFSAVGMGPRVLRVETACVAMLANLALLDDLDRGPAPGGS